MKIILVGYMGVGKTSIGKKLAKKVGISFFDLDEIIQNNQKCSINSFFTTNGEVYFRKIEHQLLKEFLSKTDDFILSLGGGTPCYANNHFFLKENDIVSIYLKDSATNLAVKLKNKKHKRPLLHTISDDNLEEYINKHLFDRSYYYLQSKFIVNSDGKKKQEIINEILEILNSNK